MPVATSISLKECEKTAERGTIIHGPVTQFKIMLGVINSKNQKYFVR